MMKRKLILAAAVMALSVTAGAVFAMDKGGKEAMPYADRMGKHAMMYNSMMKVPGLSEETQKLLHNTRKNNCEKHKAKMDDIRKKRDEAHALMKAPTFNKKAFLAKKAEMEALKMEMKKAHRESFADVAEKMTVQERTAWAEHKNKQGRMGKGRGMGMMMNEECPMMKEGSAAK